MKNPDPDPHNPSTARASHDGSGGGSTSGRNSRHSTSTSRRQQRDRAEENLPTTRRAATNRRIDSSIQIRKRRQEEQLRRKRGLSSAVLPSTANVNLETALPAVVLSLSSVETLPADEAVRILAHFQMALAANPPASTTFLQNHLKENEDQCLQLVAFLRNHLQKSFIQTVNDSSESCCLALLNLLLEITSAVQSDKSASATVVDYYGRAPVQWTDLFVPDHEESHESLPEKNASIMDLLLQMLTTLVEQQHRSINVNTMIETICNILGNLVDDGSTTRALNRLLPYWSSLLMRVFPASSYCCAALLRHDHTHYGLFFLQQSTGNNSNPSYFLLEQLADLLLQPPTNEVSTTKHVEALWILEGLSRREDDVVHAIMTNPVDRLAMTENAVATTFSRVMNALIHRLAAAAMATHPPDANAVVLPALRTIAHVGTACRGYYVTSLLTMPDLVLTVSRLLEASSTHGMIQATVTTTVEAIRVAGVLLWDAGPPGHLSTDVALPNFMPRLVALLLSQPRMEIRREVVCAIRNAFVVVGPGDSTDEHGDNGNEISHNYEALHRMEIQSHLLAQLRYFVWTSSSSISPDVSVVPQGNNVKNSDGDDDQSHQETLMRTLVDLMRSPSRTEDDTQAVLQLLDPLLRNIEASRYLFQSQGGVDALQDLFLGDSSSSQHQDYQMESSHRLAERLLDEVFEKDEEDCCCEEEEEETYGDPLASTAGMETSFVLGVATIPAAPLTLSGPFVQQHLTPIGRGRDRTVPAWISRQSK